MSRGLARVRRGGVPPPRGDGRGADVRDRERRAADALHRDLDRDDGGDRNLAQPALQHPASRTATRSRPTAWAFLSSRFRSRPWPGPGRRSSERAPPRPCSSFSQIAPRDGGRGRRRLARGCPRSGPLRTGARRLRHGSRVAALGLHGVRILRAAPGGVPRLRAPLRASVRREPKAPGRRGSRPRPGFFAGWLVLTKAVNLVFLPLALLPIVLAAVASAAPAAADVGRGGRRRRGPARRDARLRDRALRQALLVLRGPAVRASFPRRRLEAARRPEQGPAPLLPARWPLPRGSRPPRACGAHRAPRRSPWPRSPRRSSWSTPAGGRGTGAADGDRASSSRSCRSRGGRPGTAATSRARTRGRSLARRSRDRRQRSRHVRVRGRLVLLRLVDRARARLARALCGVPRVVPPPSRRERLVPALALRPGRVGRRVLGPEAPPVPSSASGSRTSATTSGGRACS